MKNYIRQTMARVKNAIANDKKERIAQQANADIIIRNDENDAENSVYVFVKGVPVKKVTKVEDAAAFLADVKRMYMQRLENMPITGK